MRVVAAAATDIGRVREGNEDSFLMEEPLFAVADGMGGHRGGEVASRLALETLESVFRRGAGDLDEQVQEANRAVFERSMLDRRVAGMGTTLTAALVEGDRVRLAHVGDSRAYLLRHGELHQLTEDHTLVRRMVTEGEITEEEARVHPQRNVMTRAIGVDMWVDVDDLIVEVRAGDRLLLCTDGLTGMVPEGRIRDVLVETPDPQGAADRLVAEANQAGGVDNITVVVIDLHDDPPAGSEASAAAAGPSGTHRSTAGDGVPTATDRAPVDRRSATRRPSVWAARARQAEAAGRVRLRRVRLRRVALLVAAVVAVVAIALVGIRVYVDRQWYVGVANGHVAVYRGIPAEIAGFQLHHVVVETTIPASQAEALALYRDLEQGITADDRAAADAIVEQIRRDVAARGGSSP